ncbi:MAG: hypothetical protein KatS3mg115_2009 [Candidatus Poribacteria bacterium]|nr:MAG: hypothetical protein KatS3mg115_2009 [Candidatus Poribacteria bacterium]
MRSPRWITAALVLLLGAATAIYSAPLGDLAGTVRDARSGRPIAGAAVSLLDRSVTTNAEGRFELQGVPVGTFRLRAEAEGYRLGSERVLISAGRVGEVLILLEPVAQAPAHQLEAVEVTAPSVSGSNRAPTSYHYRDRLDVQNEVGAGWDLQRALTSVPGVTTTSDRTNLLVVRGGSPAENQLLIDHIEVPTLSHLSWQGETGGAIALLNLDFLRDAQFYTGAFPARYGGKLSSVLDVRFREGSRERFGGEIEASMAGFGGGFEGPLRRGRGSWILSYRKGFLDPLSDKLRFEEGLDSIRFQDAHGKLVYDLSPSQQISVTALGGSDGIHIRWVRNADRAEFSSAKFAGGVTWTHSIGAVGRLRATLSHTLNDYDVQVWQKEPEPVYVNRSVERETTLEAVADLGRSEKSAWWLGVSVRRTDFHHRIRSENWQGFSENQGRLVWLPKQRIDAHPAGYRWNSFVHRDQSLGERLILRLGLRASYWTLTGARSLDPRLQLDWRPTERTRLSAAFGTVHQAPTYLELTLDPANLSLDDSRAVHWLVGVGAPAQRGHTGTA